MTHTSSLELGSSSNTAYPAMKSSQRNKPTQAKIAKLPLACLLNAMGFLPLEDFIVCKRVFKDLKTTGYVEWMKKSGYLEGRHFLAYLDKVNKPFDTTLKSIASFVQTLDLFEYYESPRYGFGYSGLREYIGYGLFLPPLGMNEDARFPKVRQLCLESVHLNKEVDAITSQAPKITHLALTNMDDEETPSLERFKHLESLSLRGYFGCEAHPFDPENLTKYCPKLKELEVTGNGDLESGIFPESCEAFAKLTQLTKAELTTDDPPECSDEDFMAFAKHPNLRELHVDNGIVTKMGLEDIASIPHLQKLFFCRQGHPDDTLLCLAKAKSLRMLSLHCPIAPPHLYGLIMSLQHAKNIVELDLFVYTVTEDLFSAIGTCTHLRSLTITLDHIREPITDEVLSHLGLCQELRSLTFRKTEADNPKEDDEELPQVEWTTQGVINLVKKLPQLQHLDIDDRHFFEIDADWLEEALFDTHPQLFVKKDRTRR